MAKFKLGDVVRLKSGGPEMTIILIAAEDGTAREKFAYSIYTQQMGKSSAYYGTNWFVGTKKEEGAFPEEALEIVQ